MSGYRKNLRSSRGQSAVEYSMLIGIIIAVVIVLSPMVKRGSQAMVKVVSDELGYQQNSEQRGDAGLIRSDTRVAYDRTTNREQWRANSTHSVLMSYGEQTGTSTNAESSLGIR